MGGMGHVKAVDLRGGARSGINRLSTTLGAFGGDYDHH